MVGCIWDNIEDYIVACVVENIENYQGGGVKGFKDFVCYSPASLKQYVNDELMPMFFPNWDIKDNICFAILNTPNYDDALEEIKRQIDELDV